MRRWLLLSLTLLFPVFAAAATPCTISATVMNFGNYSGVALTTGVTTLTVKCPSGLAYQVGTNSGSHSGSGNYNWNMLGNSSVLLHYAMYQNAAETTLWGNTPNFDTVNGTGNGANQTFTIYSQVPASEYVAPGAYTDTDLISVYSTAATVTTNLTVNATVLATCTISAGNLSFGVYAGVQIDATAAISVTCTNTTPYYVNLNNGTNSTCCWYERMTGPGGQLLEYGDYRDSARTLQWGNTYNGDGDAGTGSGTVQTLTLYSRLFAGPLVTPGLYSDTLIATITY